jgi:uncharacterized membrane protein YkvA (DUF1232 family)
MMLASLVYVVSPVDLVPGFFLPVVGELDDVTLLVLTAYLFIRWSPAEVVAEHMTSMDARHFGKFRSWLSHSAR